jgi:ABC-type transport system involved in cytochrome c biogenesis permease subunit
VLRKNRWIPAAAFGAFVVLLTAWIVRWVSVAHLPMQTMFEIFLTLAVCLFPVGVLARKLKGSGAFFGGWHGQTQFGHDAVMDIILALVILFPAGFVFSDQPQQLPPILQSPFFAPHVLAYMLSYVLMAKAAVYAIMGCFIPNEKSAPYEQSASLMVCLGFPLMCLGLILGSVWGVFAWGDWWNWDPKELWSLACVLMYAFYFHWRGYFGQKFPRINCSLIILGFVFILITLLWVNFSRLFPGLHNYAG